MMKKSEQEARARITTYTPFHRVYNSTPSQATSISAMQRMKSASLPQEDIVQFVPEEEPATAQVGDQNTTGLPDMLKAACR